MLVEIEEDDESVPVPDGTTCKRRGCGVVYKDNATSRGDGPEAQCIHHPGAPIFHEGSKGWSCCPRKVLDFDEFLKIGGCKTGKHLFVGAQSQVSLDGTKWNKMCTDSSYPSKERGNGGLQNRLVSNANKHHS